MHPAQAAPNRSKEGESQRRLIPATYSTARLRLWTGSLVPFILKTPVDKRGDDLSNLSTIRDLANG
jgi:hypothetical protein